MLEAMMEGGIAPANAEKRTRCQHIGCDEYFTEANNPEGACKYHPGLTRVSSPFPCAPPLVCHFLQSCHHFQPPVFHDGGKEWGCCKQRSHDFGLFMSIPGCTNGKHSSEKPAKPAPSPNKPLLPPTSAAGSQAGVKADCPRCRQGFFCADHRSIPGVTAKSIQPAKAPAPIPPATAPPPKEKKVVGLDETQVCKHKACGQKFTERENHDAACKYHPGPAVFHDRMRGWACCDVHVKDFDDFMAIPPCKEGWHDADPS
ncbi:putative RAR1 protein [Klebsormidium nitens]|uniref:Putative RAR1 protein n=1 Tax=Klebsormidium nitens TaxID=105231 RepID=A0A1Y1HMS2_KLENI|nr:putative RAR1 protein [Klebsormidium nitens]|eukprot:GAQ78489.1 putative RAR1 protein [Klebsormidium nitens]